VPLPAGFKLNAEVDDVELGRRRRKRLGRGR
jgi:hypothetical protein